MSCSKTIDKLKELAVKCTSASSVASVTGDTIDEVICYMEDNFVIAESNSANGLVLTDSDGAKYDVVVSTTGVLSATPRNQVATPTFTPASGETFADSIEITMACATDGASIYYTADGSTPTKESNLYDGGAMTCIGTTTIKAFADKENCTDSEVATATYTKI